MHATAMDVPEIAPRDVTWEVMSQQIKDLILLADLTGRIFYVSPACARLGYRQHDVVGRTAADFIHPEDLAAFKANAAVLIADDGTEPPCQEHWFRRKDGSWVSLEGNPSLLRGPDGQAVGVLNVLRDTTSRDGARPTPCELASDAA